ncbi:MAG: PAS domain-containing protein [Oscillochloris sp.]|nr:PAS domain-containing protein [Oscillochloris sp.]
MAALIPLVVLEINSFFVYISTGIITAIFIVLISLSAYIGGLGPGLLATALTVVLLNNLLPLPGGYFSNPAAMVDIPWAMLAVVGVLWSVLSEREHRARRQAEAKAQRYVQILSSVQEQENRFRQLTNLLPQLVWTCDSDGLCDYLSHRWSEYTGIPEADQLGYRWLEQVHPDDRERVRSSWQAMRMSDENFVTELRLRCYDGNYHWFDTRATRLRDATGRTVKWFGSNTDITEQKRISAELERSERTLKLFVEHAPAAIAMFDRDMRYIAVSRRYLFDYRISDPDIIGRSHYEIFPDIPERWKEIHRRCLAGTIEKADDDPFPRADNTLDWIRWEIHPWYEDTQSIGGLLLFSEVITERKQVEKVLLAERAQLAERIAERTADLRLANAELARATRLKDEFLANMSHELRTPLTAILGRTELLQEAIYGSLSPKQLEALHSIDLSGRHLLSLINDILDITKIEAGKIEFDPALVPVEPLCRASLQMIAQAALAKRISIHISYDSQATMIYADEGRLKQILINLLTNAVKFTPEEGTVGLEVRSDLLQRMMSFTVWDTGIGIAPDQMSQLFQPFFQIDYGLSRQYEGTGLGLALVQRLTNAHRGSIDVKSTIGQGSRFRINLPWNPDMQASLAKPNPLDLGDFSVPSLDNGQSRILLVEDNDDNSRVVEEYLCAHGYTVIVARNGVDALAYAEQEPPTAVLMDIQMPEMDGFETIRYMRSNPSLQGVLIIALTALAMPGDRQRCLEAGADAYLAKPTSLALLLTTIKSQLRLRSS